MIEWEPVVIMDAKSIFASKTFWTNVVGLAAMVAPFVPYVGPYATVLGSPEVQNQIVGAIIAVANIGLRFTTKLPIG